jgi:hypothetical protein
LSKLPCVCVAAHSRGLHSLTRLTCQRLFSPIRHRAHRSRVPVAALPRLESRAHRGPTNLCHVSLLDSLARLSAHTFCGRIDSPVPAPHLLHGRAAVTSVGCCRGVAVSPMQTNHNGQAAADYMVPKSSRPPRSLEVALTTTRSCTTGRCCGVHHHAVRQGRPNQPFCLSGASLLKRVPHAPHPPSRRRLLSPVRPLP